MRVLGLNRPLAGKSKNPEKPRFDGAFYGGAESQNRTGDTRFFRPVLYRLSYLGERFAADAAFQKEGPNGPPPIFNGTPRLP